jgi:hypothetical protein
MARTVSSDFDNGDSLQKGWKCCWNTIVLGGGWQIQTSEVIANLRITLAQKDSDQIY